MSQRIDDLNKRIEHSCLSSDATSFEIENLCTEALKYQFRAVVVNPIWVPLTRKLLKGSSVLSVTVLGFPLGAVTTDIKVAEIIKAIRLGANEFDVVMNIGYARDNRWFEVANEIRLLRYGARDKHIKVILECGALTIEQIVRACQMMQQAEVWAVKTSTGMGHGGATVDNVKLMKETVGESLKIKAAGGIRSYDQASELINAGADFIGTSAGPAIMEQMRANNC